MAKMMLMSWPVRAKPVKGAADAHDAGLSGQGQGGEALMMLARTGPGTERWRS